MKEKQHTFPSLFFVMSKHRALIVVSSADNIRQHTRCHRHRFVEILIFGPRRLSIGLGCVTALVIAAATAWALRYLGDGDW